MVAEHPYREGQTTFELSLHTKQVVEEFVRIVVSLVGTSQVNKFRSMITDAEAKSGAVLSAEDDGGADPRVTKVGRILRRTHLDEAPQLWSIFVGDMSVVGPRPERPEFDSDIQADGIRWEKRWFVKSDLTGLAQINNATGFNPEEKLRWI